MKAKENESELSKTVKLSARSWKNLACAIEGALKPIPLGTKIKTKSHTVERVRVYSYCHQCDGAPMTIGSADTVLVDGALIVDCDTDFWDNHNWQYRCSPLRLDPRESLDLELAPTEILRSLTAELPAAVLRWMAEQKAQAECLDAVTKEFTTAMSKVVLT